MKNASIISPSVKQTHLVLNQDIKRWVIIKLFRVEGELWRTSDLSVDRRHMQLQDMPHQALKRAKVSMGDIHITHLRNSI